MRKSIDTAHRSPAADEEDVLEAIHGVMHQYRAQQYRVLRDGPHDITHMESKVLGFFGRHPGATQSDLSLHSGRDKAQLARLMKGLRERGLLDASADPDDARSLRLTLTAQGHAVQRTLQQQSRRLGTKAVVGFSAAERDQLLALLQRVKANLESAG